MEKRHYQVAFTGNGEIVPFTVKDFQPNIVIVDVLQNKVAERLKADKETSNVPILLMTGHVHTRDHPTNDTDDVIQKPFNLKPRETKIQRLIA